MTDRKALRIVFMGTPDFAVASLNALVENGFQVVAVVTAVDKPAGRGRQMRPSAVKTYALSRQIPVLQPEKLKDPVFLEELASYKADLQVVVAFRMLPEVVWRMPRCGTLNVHGSLLPQYRGAAPINWALMNGDTETGVTTFFIDQSIDTGDIIDSRKVDIAPDDNMGTLHDRLMEEGALLLVDTVQSIADGTVSSHPQPACANLRPAPKIFHETCRMDWNRSARDLFNQVRGLSPYPAAWTTLHSPKGDLQLKVFAASWAPFPEGTHPNPGTLRVEGRALLAAAADGWLQIQELQVEGKKRVKAEAFLCGMAGLETCTLS